MIIHDINDQFGINMIRNTDIQFIIKSFFITEKFHTSNTNKEQFIVSYKNKLQINIIIIPASFFKIRIILFHDHWFKKNIQSSVQYEYL